MSDAAVLLACLRLLLEWWCLFMFGVLYCLRWDFIGLVGSVECLLVRLRLDWIGLLGFDCVLAVGVLYIRGGGTSNHSGR